MVSRSQSNGSLCGSSDADGYLSRVSQAGAGSQLDDNQDGSNAGQSCCLAGGSQAQAMTWDDDGALVSSPPPTGLADWTSLHRDELSKRVIQHMGMYYRLFHRTSLH
jgi:hypothetical protein